MGSGGGGEKQHEQPPFGRERPMGWCSNRRGWRRKGGGGGKEEERSLWVCLFVNFAVNLLVFTSKV